MFHDVADIWESVIVGDLSDMISPDGYFVDDLLIDVFVESIDGSGGTLGTGGQTTGTGWAHEGTLLPLRGRVTIDIADINHSDLAEVILHEIGHVLGIGTLWDDAGILVDAGTADPRYTGSEAVAQYNDIFNISSTSIPVENVGGPGSANSHWRESVFDFEIMTSVLDTNSSLSLITIGALEDLGYEVDYNQADSYRPPGTSLSFVTVEATLSTVAEEGPGAAQFTFTRTDGTVGDLEVLYSIAGSATAGIDYTTLSGIVIIEAGDTTVTVDVCPLTDADSEGLETVIVTVEPGAGYTVGSPRYATITIEDDEFVEPVVPLSYVITVQPGETIDNLDFGSRIENNEPPFVEDILTDINVNEDAPNTIVDLFSAFGDLEDADADLTFTVSENTNPGLFASLVIDPMAGTLTLDYAANANGASSLTIQATDTGGQSITQTFDVTVNAVNDAPVATPAVNDTPEDIPLEFDLRTLVNDVETSDDELMFSVSDAVNGSVELLADGYTARFTPLANYNGPASFTYQVTDTGDGSDPATTIDPVSFTVNVLPVNDEPTFSLGSDLTVNEDSGDHSICRFCNKHECRSLRRGQPITGVHRVSRRSVTLLATAEYRR